MGTIVFRLGKAFHSNVAAVIHFNSALILLLLIFREVFRVGRRKAVRTSSSHLRTAKFLSIRFVISFVAIVLLFRFSEKSNAFSGKALSRFTTRRTGTAVDARFAAFSRHYMLD